MAAVRRVLVYWGNIPKTKRRALQRLAEIEDELANLYDLQPAQLSGMPHGSEISDTTARRAAKAICSGKALKREQNALQGTVQRLERDYDLIEREVMCLPPLQCEIITLRYCEYGYAKRDYWRKIAERVHTNPDYARQIERKGVRELTKHLSFPDTKVEI